MSGSKILKGLHDAVAGNFASVTIEGQRWVRADAPAASEPVAWRIRFKTAYAVESWNYIEGSDRPHLNRTDSYDVEPLGVIADAASLQKAQTSPPEKRPWVHNGIPHDTAPRDLVLSNKITNTMLGTVRCRGDAAETFATAELIVNTVNAAIQAQEDQRSAASTVEPVAWQWRYIGNSVWNTQSGGAMLTAEQLVGERPIEQRPLYAAPTTSPNPVVADYATTETPEPDAVREATIRECAKIAIDYRPALRMQEHEILVVAETAVAIEKAILAALSRPAHRGWPTREQIARSIDPMAFDGWQGLYDANLEKEGADFSRRCADAWYGEKKEAAFKTADAVLAYFVPRNQGQGGGPRS